jgi:hypothetical protein
MSQFSYIFILLLVTQVSIGQQWKFNFFDAGKRKYNSTRLIDDIQNNNHLSISNVHVLIPLTPSLNDSIYVQQSRTIDSLDAESSQFITVIACTSNEYRDGYHTDKNTARRLANKHSQVRIAVLDRNCFLLYATKQVINSERFKEIFKHQK